MAFMATGVRVEWLGHLFLMQDLLPTVSDPNAGYPEFIIYFTS